MAKNLKIPKFQLFQPFIKNQTRSLTLIIQADCQALFGGYSRELSHFSECVSNSFVISKKCQESTVSCVRQYSLVSSMRTLIMIPFKFTFVWHYHKLWHYHTTRTTRTMVFWLRNELLRIYAG